MTEPLKKINPKNIPHVILFLFIAIPIVFALLGTKTFFIILFIFVFIFREKLLNNLAFKNFLINLTNKNNMANQMPDAENYKQPLGKVWKILKFTVLFFLGTWILSWFIVIVWTGETGVYTLFGKVRDQELNSGLHLVNPLAKIQKMSVRTEQYTMNVSGNGQKNGDDSISALTKEGLDVNIDFTALYHLDENKASDVYREVGLDYVEKVIRPEIRGIIRTITSQYEAKELYSEKRQEASQKIYLSLKEKIEPRGIILEEAVIRNVGLPASLAKAIQEKLAAEQEAQRYDFVLDKEKKEADRKRIEAEGQRDAQKIISESLGGEYLNYLYIKELKDRQGTIYVPISPSTGMPLFKNIGE